MTIYTASYLAISWLLIVTAAQCVADLRKGKS